MPTTTASPDLSAQSTAGEDRRRAAGADPLQHRARASSTSPAASRFGLQNEISAFVNDRFGNAVPPGTVGLLHHQRRQRRRPERRPTPTAWPRRRCITEGKMPPTGIVTVIAFTRGEEGFLDNNGNGVFDAGDRHDHHRQRASSRSPTSARCRRSIAGLRLACLRAEPVLQRRLRSGGRTSSTSSTPAILDGVWDTQGTTGVWDNDILVFATTPVTFSGPLTQSPLASPDLVRHPGRRRRRRSTCSRCTTICINPLVGGSTITVERQRRKGRRRRHHRPRRRVVQPAGRRPDPLLTSPLSTTRRAKAMRTRRSASPSPSPPTTATRRRSSPPASSARPRQCRSHNHTPPAAPRGAGHPTGAPRLARP